LTEAWSGHECRITDVGRGNLADTSRPGDVRDLAQVIGHVAGSCDAAVDVPSKTLLGFGSVRRRREMLVRINKPRQQELALEVEPGCAGNLHFRECRIRNDRGNSVTISDHGHISLQAMPGAIDQRCVPIDGAHSAVRWFECRSGTH
jgi:hypothetical protein